MKVVLVELEGGGVEDVFLEGLKEVSEELSIKRASTVNGAVEVVTDDPVGAHLKMAKFPGVHRVGVFEKVPAEETGKALIELAKKLLREDMTFELSVKTLEGGDATAIYYELMGRLIDHVDAKPDEYMPERLLRVVLSRGSGYIEYFGLTGPGGRPLGSKGGAVVAFSGGFKSYVAALRAARAGFRPYLLFVHPPGAPKEYVRRAFYKAWTLVRGLPMKGVELFVAKPDRETIYESGFLGVLISAMEEVGKRTGVEYAVLGFDEVERPVLKALCEGFVPILPNLGLSRADMELVLLDEEDRHKLDWSEWKPGPLTFKKRGRAELLEFRIGRGPVDWHKALDEYPNGEV